ncbi:MAG: 2-succinyl-5-enolpyruvyl-6-hydroxy-3-cyclohexene-1-carboxylic-acid synthase [Paludibacter sp.]|jgi:2-succinyl-5-enolpyruvyl-6-hydroxy-3-cyclohexene-1-carboxylate synthase|nr:2-succinyl-5-enolpyruvyl-6-hydroxy-3-cyclohexene-1-carboxylic-acid synthase [Paludibacter sp.]
MNNFRQAIKNIPEICARQGVKYAVICPGSRNAPLILAFTEHVDIECISITDERSAAYFALGIAQATENPVALICTSGTAALNFAPAIAEAYYQGLPLTVFTADRPRDFIDKADGQTIRQQNVFANFVKRSFELPDDTEKQEDLLFSDLLVSQAIDVTRTFPRAPVHINVPLREPLYAPLPEAHTNPKIIRTLRSKTTFDENSEILIDLQKFSKKMLVFGVLPKNNELAEIAAQLAEYEDFVVISENLSNICGVKIITQPETLFARINAMKPAEQLSFAPELLITVGQNAISKQLKIFLRNHKPLEHWQLHCPLPYADTYDSLTRIIDFEQEIVSSFLLAITKKEHSTVTFSSPFFCELKTVQERHEQIIGSQELSDMTAVNVLLKNIPENTNLQLANSTAVRWTQLFPAKPTVKYLCNRGVSGIDGSVSTAAGYAFVTNENTVLLTGDLAFIYDSNALWNNYLSKKFKIIVLNNNGGNIFKNIANHETIARCEDFFTTPHNVQIKHLAAAFCVDYLLCNEFSDLECKIIELLKNDKCSVLEIVTDSEINTENYLKYFEF